MIGHRHTLFHYAHSEFFARFVFSTGCKHRGGFSLTHSFCYVKNASFEIGVTQTASPNLLITLRLTSYCFGCKVS